MRIYLDESQFEKDNLIKHFNKHKSEYITDPRFANVNNEEEFRQLYNKIADELSRKHVSKSDSTDQYVGYIDKKGRYIKYDRVNYDLIIYIKDISVSMYKIDGKRYDIIKSRDFKKEFWYNR